MPQKKKKKRFVSYGTLDMALRRLLNVSIAARLQYLGGLILPIIENNKNGPMIGVSAI